MLSQITNHKSQIANPPLGVSPVPRFVMTLNAEGVSDALVRVPLAITGKWVRGATSFTITRQDLEDIVRNFRERQNGEINVDYDHASEMPEVAAGGPVPSAGRIVKLDAPEPASGLATRDSGDHPLIPSLSRRGARRAGWLASPVSSCTAGTSPRRVPANFSRAASTATSRPPSTGQRATSAPASPRAPRSLPWR